MVSINLNNIAILKICCQVIVVLLTGLAKSMLYIYCKMLIRLSEEEYYKNKKINKCTDTYKMSKEIKTFGNIVVKKQKFHQPKSPISIFDVNIGKIVVSNKVPFGKKKIKYFTG